MDLDRRKQVADAIIAIQDAFGAGPVSVVIGCEYDGITTRGFITITRASPAVIREVVKHIKVLNEEQGGELVATSNSASSVTIW